MSTDKLKRTKRIKGGLYYGSIVGWFVGLLLAGIITFAYFLTESNKLVENQSPNLINIGFYIIILMILVGLAVFTIEFLDTRPYGQRSKKNES